LVEKTIEVALLLVIVVIYIKPLNQPSEAGKGKDVKANCN
jgi:hypothetical protein